MSRSSLKTQLVCLGWVVGFFGGLGFAQVTACSSIPSKEVVQAGVQILDQGCDLAKKVDLPGPKDDKVDEFCVAEEDLRRAIQDIVSARPVPTPVPPASSAVPLASASSSSRSFALKTDPGAVAATSASARPATLRVRIRR